MPRDMTAAVEAELDKSEVRLGLFVEMLFDGGAFRVWSGVGDRTLNGNVFKGVGNLGGISKIDESSGDVRASGVAFSLSGIANVTESGVDQLSLVMNEHFQGREVRCWRAVFDLDWGLIGNPLQLTKCELDYPVIAKGGDTFGITVYAESILADLERPRVHRYTDEDQQTLSPGDTFLSRVTSIQNMQVTWTRHE